MRAPRFLLPLLLWLPAACQAPAVQDGGLRPVDDQDLGELAHAVQHPRTDLALAQATAGSPDSRVLAACLAFPQQDGALLLVLYVTEISEDGQLSLRGRYQQRPADADTPFLFTQEHYELEVRPAGTRWGELYAGGKLNLEYRARP